MSDTTIGFIGLGRMGGRISTRLAANGHRIIAFDAAGTEERAGKGVVAAASVGEVAQRCEIVALSLPDGAACSAVTTEIAATDRRTVTIVVDLSTIGMAAAEACAGTLSDAGVAYVDAPVSGGVAGASSGKLAMMASGDREILARTRPLLERIAQSLFVVGELPGRGQAMKLLNNYVSATALAATFEAVVFGRGVGLDLQLMVDVLNASSGRTTASTDKLPQSVVPGTYDFGFAAEAMRKDVMLYLEAAIGSEAPHQLGSASDGLWKRFSEACPGTDFTYLHRYLEDGGA